MNARRPVWAFSDEDIAAYADQTLDEPRREALAQALRDDLALRQRVREAEELIQRVRTAPIGPKVDLVHRVRQARRAPARAPNWSAWAGRSALAMAAAVALVWVIPSPSPDGPAAMGPDEMFQARSGASVAHMFRAYRVTSPTLQPIAREGAVVHKDDAFAFSYGLLGDAIAERRAADAGDHLAVFILSGDAIFWCVPFWSPEGDVPVLEPVRMQQEPTHQVRHELHEGKATLVAWFAPDALALDAIERTLVADGENTRPDIRNLKGGHLIQVPLEVVP